MTAIVFAIVLPWLLIAVGLWLVYHLIRQNGRILLRLDSIDTRLGPREVGKRPKSGGLPIGTFAPDFELPDLMGARHGLSEFRGLDLLLIFFNPQCGFCTRMAGNLATLPPEGGHDRLVPIVITTGDLNENRKLVEQYGIHCIVLLQREMEVASQYGAQGTPMGYRIDGAGRIASEIGVGAEPLLKMAAGSASDTHEPVAPANGAASHAEKDYRSLAASRLNRNGLKAGTVAPAFRLPRIEGGNLSLSDFLGERVLLVFSDPECAPCDELAPRLQELHSLRSDLRVLVVGRREIEANRVKASRLGLSYPIVVQKQWEISLLYAMFATPIGYLIDERGFLASDAAIGIEPILALAEMTNHAVIAQEPVWAN